MNQNKSWRKNSCFDSFQVNNIPGIEEVNMIKDDGTVIHFNNPKVQASLAANTFAVTGHGENKQITDLLPGILNQLGAESLTHLKKLGILIHFMTVFILDGDNKCSEFCDFRECGDFR